MSIKEKPPQIKSFNEKQDMLEPERKGRRETIVLTLIIVLVGTGGYGLGRLSKIESERMPVRIEQIDIFNALGANVGGSVSQNADTSNDGSVPASVPSAGAGGQVVGSKNSDKYHYPWCSGAKRISDANKVTFASIEEARAKGYVPASNCPGLK